MFLIVQQKCWGSNIMPKLGHTQITIIVYTGKFDDQRMLEYTTFRPTIFFIQRSMNKCHGDRMNNSSGDCIESTGLTGHLGDTI